MSLRLRFQLTPLDQATPWREHWPHWFGLTDGVYWIELDGHKLLCDNGVPYVDYYVARFWEDLVDATRDLFAGRTHDFNLGYLRNPPSLRLKRTKNRVRIQWQDDIVITTVPLKDWLAALREFDREFIAAMAERLGDDLDVRAEHEQRARWYAERLP